MMITSRRVLVAMLLVAAGSFVACERTNELGTLTGPQYGVNSNGLRLTRVLKSTAYSGQSRQCFGPISRNGGTFTHTSGLLSVTVTRGAVQSATVFCVTPTTNEAGEIIARLQAYDWSSNNLPEIHEFKASVRVTFNLSTVAVEDWSRVGVAYRNGAALDPVPTAIDRNSMSVTATLSHFSDYSPVEN